MYLTNFFINSNWSKCLTVSGGDFQEAIADGLKEAIRLKWDTQATKVCVIITDSCPHGLRLGTTYDAFPHGKDYPLMEIFC